MFQVVVYVRLGCAREPGIRGQILTHLQVMVRAELRTKEGQAEQKRKSYWKCSFTLLRKCKKSGRARKKEAKLISDNTIYSDQFIFY